LDEIFESFCSGVAEAEALTGIKVRLTPDISRGVPGKIAEQIARTAVKYSPYGIVGLGIGGDEESQVPQHTDTPSPLPTAVALGSCHMLVNLR